MKKAQEEEEEETITPECFIIMPITDPDGYESGHFKKVYEDIIKVACDKAGYKAVRADDVTETNLIHLDILQRLIHSPTAICDLSNRNPNVLFELGLRQAFDKPTVLIQEHGTPKIFDISPIRIIDYTRELRYRDVLHDQEAIAEVIRTTKAARDKGEGINSLISLLSLSNPASLKDVTDSDTASMLQIIMSQMNELRSEFRKTKIETGSDYVDNKLYELGELVELKGETETTYSTLYADTKRNLDKLKAMVLTKAPHSEIDLIYNKIVSNGGKLNKYSLGPATRGLVKKLLREAFIVYAGASN